MQDFTRPHDIAHQLRYSQRDRRVNLFRSLSLPSQSAVLVLLSPHIQQEILAVLSIDEAVEVIDYLDLHIAHSILLRVEDQKRRKEIMNRLKEGLREKSEHFVSFHPKATAALVSFDYILVSEDMTVGALADAIAEYRHGTGKSPEILVQRAGELIGSIPMNTLIRERSQSHIARLVEQIQTIDYAADPRRILDFFTRAPHTMAAVLDSDKSVIGIIYADDIIAFFNDQGNESLYDFAGVSESERPFDSISHKVARRWKWLLLNLGTAFLAAGTVTLFESTIAQVVVLAAYLPIVSGMGGNAATQTLAVMVRGITVGDISLRQCKQALINEVAAGAVNGIITGAVVALIAIFWNESPLLGLVVAISMIVNLIVAGFFGTITPLVLKRFGKDPATSAIIFITTATDVFGFLVFLSLAKLLLV